MKRMNVMLICILTGLLISIVSTVSAEEHYDYRTDTRSYCRMVAELNAGVSDGLEAQSRGEREESLVIFRTSVVPLDFSSADFQMFSAVYGPEGFSVLLCDNPDGAVKWLLAQPGVSCAEVDAGIAACTVDEETTEISFQSWAAASMGYGDYIPFAGQYGDGAVTVAVIDSGVYRHSLITPRVRRMGYDYVDNDTDPTNDLNGHGTRVAGIVADCTRGLPVYIYPIRVLDADAGGRTSNVISAILEAAEADVEVINLSLSTFVHSEMLEDAVRSAVASGTTVVVAAGNYSCDASEVTPANMRDHGVIVVGSADADGNRSSFSNYGDSVDVYAYGRGIVTCSRSGGYVTDSGTSMAAPHVSALCAMMDLVHPSLSPGDMETRIHSAASGSIRIPSAAAMVPRTLGFSLSCVRLPAGAQLPLPLMARPATAQEAISYECGDAAVAQVVDGALTAGTAGTTQITVRCKGFEDSVFTVEVSDEVVGDFVLPADLMQIGSEAFYGIRARRVTMGAKVLSIGDAAFDGGKISFLEIPASVAEIGDNAFSGAVILCSEGSFALEYAIGQGLQYLLKTSE